MSLRIVDELVPNCGNGPTEIAANVVALAIPCNSAAEQGFPGPEKIKRIAHGRWAVMIMFGQRYQVENPRGEVLNGLVVLPRDIAPSTRL